MQGQIRFTIEEKIGRITISNPPGNLLTPKMTEDLDGLRNFIDDTAVKALLIHGEGNQFCAGSSDSIPDEKSLIDQLKAICVILAYAPVPVVAAVEGTCLDAGYLLAIHCPTIIASPDAAMGFRRWKGPPVFDKTILPSRGIKASFNILLDGTITGAEAEKKGLVEKTVPSSQVIAASRHYLENLIDNRSPALVRAVMESIHNARRLPLEHALQAESVLFDTIVTSAASVSEKAG